MQRTLTVIVAVILLATFSHAQARRGPRFSEWATPVHLPPPINTEFDDHAAVLSKDEKTMFFTSNRPGSVMDSEISGSLSAETARRIGRRRVRLSTAVNTPAMERVRSISADRTILQKLSSTA